MFFCVVVLLCEGERLIDWFYFSKFCADVMEINLLVCTKVFKLNIDFKRAT